jgi:hypothetical protein
MEHLTVGWTITFGEALTVVSILSGAIGIFFGMKADVRVVKHDLHALNEKFNTLNSAFSGLSDILTTVAVQDNRLNRLEEDMREFRHGEGMVLPLKRGAFEAP